MELEKTKHESTEANTELEQLKSELQKVTLQFETSKQFCRTASFHFFFRDLDFWALLKRLIAEQWLEDTKAELETTKTELEATKTELKTTKTELERARIEMSKVRANLEK
ncbi:undecaprenyl pyrophosphate phosphatase, partial [Reticulomyxa filosa]